MENKILLKILKKESVSRPAVWIMRQAGRYLPGYRELRKKYDFFELTKNPDLVSKITLEPIEIFDMDAAIIFSDILVIPEALGMEVQMKPGIGPLLTNTISSQEDILNLNFDNLNDRLSYVFDSISLTREKLQKDKTLIGFAGAPFTLMCYMVEGRGTKAFNQTRIFCHQNPKLAHLLLNKLTDSIISYLKKQIESGADCVQVFDSWASILDEKGFDEFIIPYLERIVTSVKKIAPVIIFAKGKNLSLEKLVNLNASGLSIDYLIEPEKARFIVGDDVILQGNMDPAFLFKSESDIESNVKNIIKKFGEKNYISNLGHGILPNTPISGVKSFVDTVKNYKYE